ncbi:ribosomal protein S18-alanine N-acetyltransferase [Neisseria montereyensis]|uniref:[Ribosomal protein bS18]-alanine N-acetyltransferase n=1 Tax=Neisseria montereyensis TaxID=2973938 RepID=A0ABT2FEL5_9NEIS|nr:ribosomal protein S18-alanine N-acetyltransferase [Neisseria montereyensis]
MIIRLAEERDIAALAELDALCNPSPWSAAQFQTALNSRVDTVKVLADEHSLIGFAVWQTVCDESELHLIAVHPNRRRSGAASQLMRDWFQTALAQQVTRLFLEVRATNEAAKVLYGKFGFTECGRRKNYYALPDGSREDAVLMEKSC